MEVQTMGMDPRIARVHYLDYRKKCKEHKKKRIENNKQAILDAGRELRRVRTKKSELEREDEELMRAYRAMEKGQRIINLAQVMRNVGLCDEMKLPRLAIVRADAKHVKVDANRTRTVFADAAAGWYPSKTQRVEVPSSVFGAELWNNEWRTRNHYPLDYTVKALAPKIPPRHDPGDLTEYYLLWEPKWEGVPDPDPMLLSRIGDNFFAVVAVWDMTPLEQSILESRLL